MAVQVDSSGRRSVQVEIEVPGSPDEVWQAIASGPGISSWFVSTTFEHDSAGVPTRVISNFGPGMESVSDVTEWHPPHRFSADSRDDLGPDDPTVATEWVVEAKSGGTCVVRIVHSWFMATDDWDSQFEGHAHGWASFFQILRLYLAHFSGQSCTSARLIGFSRQSDSKTWELFCSLMGLTDLQEGERFETVAGAPALAGTAERVTNVEHGKSFLLRLNAPGPGIASLFVLPMGGQVMIVVDLFFYGDSAGRVARVAEESWQAWMSEHFPAGVATPLPGA